MRARLRRLTGFIVIGVALFSTPFWLDLPTPSAQSAETIRFFPVAVWYGGGKARAPMLEGQARSKNWNDFRQRQSDGDA